MSKSERATCENCPFWDQPGEKTEPGECRIRSTMPTVGLGGGAILTPRRYRDEWCGEHPDFETKRHLVAKFDPPMTATEVKNRLEQADPGSFMPVDDLNAAIPGFCGKEFRHPESITGLWTCCLPIGHDGDCSGTFERSL